MKALSLRNLGSNKNNIINNNSNLEFLGRRLSMIINTSKSKNNYSNNFFLLDNFIFILSIILYKTSVNFVRSKYIDYKAKIKLFVL